MQACVLISMHACLHVFEHVRMCNCVCIVCMRTCVVMHVHICIYLHVYVTEFVKTDLMGTNTEIHFLPVDERHTHALSRNTKHLRLDGQVCFFRRLFSDAVKPRGCISWPVWPLRGINKTAWGAKLILTAGLAYPVSCASLGHLLTAQHYHLCLNVSKQLKIHHTLMFFQLRLCLGRAGMK